MVKFDFVFAWTRAIFTNIWNQQKEETNHRHHFCTYNKPTGTHTHTQGLQQKPHVCCLSRTIAGLCLSRWVESRLVRTCILFPFNCLVLDSTTGAWTGPHVKHIHPAVTCVWRKDNRLVFHIKPKSGRGRVDNWNRKNAVHNKPVERTAQNGCYWTVDSFVVVCDDVSVEKLRCQQSTAL